MISIGAVLGGPEVQSSAIDRMIGFAMQSAHELGLSYEGRAVPSINVVFYVPGAVGRPDWDGLRDSTFSRRKNLLMVQVAVPESVVGSSNAGDFVIDSLRGANAVAFEFYRRKGIDFPLGDAEALVSQISERMSDESAT